VVIKKPANIDFAAAASIPLVGLTTVQCFDKARLTHFPMPLKPYFTKKAAMPKEKLSLG
jgi:NADPH:quinone reductase-like Zn-dependent oxidoreductase